MYTQLELSVNHKKSLIGTVAEFLGIELDTIRMQARLPPDKLDRVRSTLKSMLLQPTVSRRELESLVGLLSFAAKVVVPGRAFLRRLFRVLSYTSHISIIRIDSSMKADLTWWNTFLIHWNGIKLLRLTVDRKHCCIWTDASGSHGMGGYFLNHPSELPYVQHVFSRHLPTRDRLKDI